MSNKVELNIEPLSNLLGLVLAPIALAEKGLALPDLGKQLIVASVTDVTEEMTLEEFTNEVNTTCNEKSLLEVIEERVSPQDKLIELIYESKK